MKKIYKYTLSKLGRNMVNMPFDAKILSVVEQEDKVVVYAMVDSEDAKFPREFRVYGTGYELNEDIGDFKFLGTVNTENGVSMWHVFVDRSDE